MATKTIAQLKAGRDFVDVLDSALNLTDGGTVAGAVSAGSVPQANVWNVLINGVPRQILLA